MTSVSFLLLMGGSFYFLLILPLWAIADCLKQKERSKAFRFLWVAGIVLLSPFAPLVYGMFFSPRRGLKISAYAGAVFSVVLIVIVVIVLPKMMGYYRELEPLLKSLPLK